MDGLVCRHELESLDGIVLVSRANQAAAFDRIARSSRSWRTSRRSRRSSSCSSVVRPSVRSPASSAACFTQFRIACAEGSNWRASSSGVRPLRTSSTIRWRNSGEYGGWLFGIVDLPFRPNDGVSTKPGQLQLAVAFVACAFDGFALGLAWATPPLGVTTTIISGPTQLGEIHVKSESDVNEVKIKTEGLSDVYVVYNRIVPGGHTGWHSHPGPSIISVKSGTATEYHADDPVTP